MFDSLPLAFIVLERRIADWLDGSCVWVLLEKHGMEIYGTKDDQHADV